MLDAEGLIVVCATMSLFHEIQIFNRKSFESYIEVYLDVDMDKLIIRDSKGFYTWSIK